MAFEAVYVGRNAKDMVVSPEYQAYTGVRLTASDNVVFEAGDASGRILEVSSVWGSQAAANAILKKIKGYKYRPFEANNAVMDMAAELGDGVSIDGVYSGLYQQTINFSALMTSKIAAPKGNDTDHEYPYASKATRRAQRQYDDIKASLKINRESIEAKVEKSGGSASSFGWNLTDTAWTIQANGSTVLKATKAGLEVSGKVTATSGTIGGCTIENGVLKINSANIGSINANTITVGTLSVDRIANSSITGTKVASSTITGGNVAGYTLSGGNFTSGVNTMLSQGSTAYSFYSGALTAAQISVNAIYMNSGSSRYGPVTFTFTDGKGNTQKLSCIGLISGYD